MRSEREMLDLIIKTAEADECIRAVSMEGSRANPSAPKDQYQDYDVNYYVSYMAPFYDNPAWIIGAFGEPLIMQTPESMSNPAGGGHFNYMMIFADGCRLDLTFTPHKYASNGEPMVALLDKDDGKGFLPALPPPNDAVYHIRPPSPLDYCSCCNEFWWCLNNVAKGIARDELPYVMYMLNEVVREELHRMIVWHIGVRRGFGVSAGKNGKYYKRLLPPEIYAQYAATYPDSAYDSIWKSIFIMCDLFHFLAIETADHFGYKYNQNEEHGMREYIGMVKGHKI